MKTCIQCGLENSEAVEMCVACGTKIFISQAVDSKQGGAIPPAADVRPPRLPAPPPCCPSCGHPVPQRTGTSIGIPELQDCSNCGRRFDGKAILGAKASRNWVQHLLVIVSATFFLLSLEGLHRQVNVTIEYSAALVGRRDRLEDPGNGRLMMAAVAFLLGGWFLLRAHFARPVLDRSRLAVGRWPGLLATLRHWGAFALCGALYLLLPTLGSQDGGQGFKAYAFLLAASGGATGVGAALVLRGRFPMAQVWGPLMDALSNAVLIGLLSTRG